MTGEEHLYLGRYVISGVHELLKAAKGRPTLHVCVGRCCTV